jgi:hypothetical protein
MILNKSTSQTCAACEDTGIVVLAGTFKVGKREMQPEATGCIWCEIGTTKLRRLPGAITEYTLEDVDLPVDPPNLNDQRVRKACEDAFKEFQRAFRAMQKESQERDTELQKGAPSPPRGTIPA